MSALPSAGTRVSRVSGVLLLSGLGASFLAARVLGKARVFALLDSLPPACPLKIALGLQCSFCGMTHAFLHLFFGEGREALRANLLSIPVFAGVLAVSGGWAAGRLPSIPVERGRALAWTAIGVLLAYTVLRNLF